MCQKLAQFSDTHDLLSIEEPYDNAELLLLQKLEALQQEYRAKAQPFVDAFLAYRARKPIKYVMVPKGEKG